MIYQSRLKKLTKERNKTLNFQLQKNATLVKVMAQNPDILQIDVLTVVEMEK